MNDDPSKAKSSAPDFTKVGFGAMGNVEVKHDASQHTIHDSSTTSHTHHDDKSQHSHVHYHGVPELSAVGSGVVGRAKGRSVNITIVLSLGVLSGLGVWLLKTQTQPPAPVALPVQITIQNNPASIGSTTATPASMGSTTATPVSMGSTTVTPVSTGVVPDGTVLQLKLNRSSYRVGDPMEITVTSQKEGNLYVLAVWADGRVDTLFPNSLRPDPKVAKDTQIILPTDFPPTADGKVLSYSMSMPALPGNPSSTTESIVAVLSPTPLNLPQSTELASRPGFAAVGMLDDPDFRTRGPQPKFMNLQSKVRLDFGGLPQAAVHYDVHR